MCFIFSFYDKVVAVRRNEIGGACGMYGGNERCIQGFGERNLKERGHLEHHSADMRIILKWILKKEDGVVRNRFIWFSIGRSGGLL
jgi:hypothetical protein